MPLTFALPSAALSLLAPPVLLVQDAPPGPQFSYDTLIMMGVPLLIFWFLLIRPERKEKKRKAAMLENLQKNDRVLTTFGMYASIAAVNEDDLTLKLDDGNTRVRVLKSTIASVITPQGEEAGKDKG